MSAGEFRLLLKEGGLSFFSGLWGVGPRGTRSYFCLERTWLVEFIIVRQKSDIVVDWAVAACASCSVLSHSLFLVYGVPGIALTRRKTTDQIS